MDNQQQALEETLQRGQAFEELIRIKGWEYVKAWYQAKVQMFATSLLMKGEEKIETFEPERQELIGLRKLMGMIENDISITRKHYEAKQSPKK